MVFDIKPKISRGTIDGIKPQYPTGTHTFYQPVDFI